MVGAVHVGSFWHHQNHASPFLLGILGVWHSGQMGISVLMFSRGVSSQLIARERKYVAVMSVGLPGVVLWHVSCPKLCCALPEASHVARLWPGIINRHLTLLSQESGSCPSTFSEILAKWLFVMHWVEWSPSGDAMHSHPSSLSVLPVVSRFVTRVILLSIRSMLRFSVGAISFWCSAFDAEAIHKCIFSCLELSQVAR